jgi:hypothetical protein
MIARKGKIARLPLDLRRQLNQRPAEGGAENLSTAAAPCAPHRLFWGKH